MGNVSWVSYSFSCRVKNLKCGDTTLLICVPHTRREGEVKSEQPLLRQKISGCTGTREWWVGFFGGSSAVRFMFRARPFVIMAECKQTDIIWRLLHQDLPLLHSGYKTGRRNTQKRPERFSGFIFQWCHRELEWIIIVLYHGSLRKPQKWDTFWWTPTHILKLLVCELMILTDLWRFVLQIEVVCKLLG